MSKKILVTDKIAPEAIAMLRDAGYQVDVRLEISHEDLVKAIPGYHALIVRSGTAVDREVLTAATKLRIVGRAGVSVDNIDLAAATERGIIVCNAPASNIISAAEQAFALMLAAARKIPQAHASMKAHEWRRSDFEGVELYGKTLGIFGLGRVGCLVAERARAFGMNVIAHDPFCSRARAVDLGITIFDEVEDVLSRADVVSVHLPKTPDTYGMFGPNEFAAMKDGVIVIDTSRGGIVNAKSMADFIAAGKIAACGVDVWEEEPCTDSPLHGFDNVVITPHLGASTREAQLRVGKMIAEYVMNGLEGSVVPSALNLAPMPPEVVDAIGPYVPACKLIGNTLAQLRSDIPTKLILTTAGTIAGCNTDILTASVLDGILSYKSSIRVTSVNVDSLARRHGIRAESQSTADAGEYASYVMVQADDLAMACTFTEAGMTPRIVSLLGYKIDIAPAKHSLIFEYEDRPGRIGIIGTILGEEGINITTMQIGTKPEEQNALVYMKVAQEVPKRVLERLEHAMDMHNLWYIRL